MRTSRAISAMAPRDRAGAMSQGCPAAKVARGFDLAVRIKLLRLNTLTTFENCGAAMANATLGVEGGWLPHGEARAIVLRDLRKQ